MANELPDVQYVTYDGHGNVIAEGGLKSRRDLLRLFHDCLSMFGSCAGSQKDYTSGKKTVWVFCRCDDSGDIGESCNFRRTVVFL